MIRLIPTTPAHLHALRRIISDRRVEETLFRDRSPFDFYESCLHHGPLVHFTALDRKTAIVVGGASLTEDEFCYFVDPALWRRGIGTAVATAALEAAWSRGQANLRLRIMRENVASVRIAERLGFRFAGLHRNANGGLMFLDYRQPDR